MMKLEPHSMTTEEVIAVLVSRGLTVKPDRDGVRPILYDGTERVGTLYEDEVYIASEFPHLRDNSYKDTKKQGAVKLSSNTARSDLEYCIQVLFNSPAAFEAEMRGERVKKVRRYFDIRRRI